MSQKNTIFDHFLIDFFYNFENRLKCETTGWYTYAFSNLQPKNELGLCEILLHTVLNAYQNLARSENEIFSIGISSQTLFFKPEFHLINLNSFDINVYPFFCMCIHVKCLHYQCTIFHNLFLVGL